MSNHGLSATHRKAACVITLSEVYFTITGLVFVITLINIQPYKTITLYLLWTDLVSLFLLGWLYITMLVDQYIDMNTFTTHHIFIQ